jgi:transcriptional regulator with XRE-family HTH domain
LQFSELQIKRGAVILPGELIRIGEKIISFGRIEDAIQRILELRAAGFSQQEVAGRLGLDRTFISRLETLGELRKGKRLAVIGFPLSNYGEIDRIAKSRGVEFTWLMSEKERWELVGGQSALEFFDLIMEKIASLQRFDLVIFIGSRKWQKIAEALLDCQVLFLELGSSPITEDCTLEPQRFEELLNQVIGVP